MRLLLLLMEIGFTLSSEGSSLVVVPASELTDPLRDLIRDNKAELLAAVREAERGAADLIASIGHCCDVRGDDDRNRAALIVESALLVPHEQADMLAHFEAETTRWQQANRGKQP